MFFQRIKASGILSFGPKGIDLPMRNLNVLIGPNGSGKTNFLELIQLFKEAPTPGGSISRAMGRNGGIDEWLWKGDWGLNDAPPPALIQCEVSGKSQAVRHKLEFFARKFRLYLADEVIEILGDPGDSSYPWWVYRYCSTGSPFHAQFHDFGPIESDGPETIRKVSHDELEPGSSILSQIRDPSRYKVFEFLEKSYSEILLYRDWCFGPNSRIRKPSQSDGPSGNLNAMGDNLALMVAAMPIDVEGRVVHELRVLYPEIVAVKAKPSGGGTLEVFIIEEGNREIPASRLSDGTLRFLGLLVILLSDPPGRLIVIEEPELGLHPDVIPRLAALLIEASTRTQIIITTHSRMLVDALGDDPESVVVCEKQNGESVFERLDGDRMKVWLEKYSLGELWSKGEIGGNRW